jgi:hypothetical protein
MRSLSSGEAQLQLADGTPRTLRSGDKVGSDTVESVEPGRILLRRKDGGGAGGGGLVVVTFDAAGAARVRVYLDVDPSARPARDVQ